MQILFLNLQCFLTLEVLRKLLYRRSKSLLVLVDCVLVTSW